MNYIKFLYSPKGKINHIDFLWGVFFSVFAPAIIWFIFAVSVIFIGPDNIIEILGISFGFSFFLMLYGFFCITIKRAADLGWAWFFVFIFLPILNFLLYFYIRFIKKFYMKVSGFLKLKNSSTSVKKKRLRISIEECVIIVLTIVFIEVIF